MADLSILAGSTSQSILVDLYVLATGAPQTGLVYNSSGLTAYYSFVGANSGSTAITLATQTTGTAWATGGFVKLSDTQMPGVYNFDVPNAVLAASKGREVWITFTGYSGMATRTIKLELTGWNNQDAVHGGMSALPNTACTTNASLLTSGTGTDQLSVAAGVAKANATAINSVSTASVTTVNANIGATQALTFDANNYLKVDLVDIAGSAVSASTAQLGVNVVNIAGTASAGTAGYMALDWAHISAPTTTQVLSGTTVGTATACGTLTTYTGNTPQTGDSYARLGAPAGASVSADVAAIKSETDTILTDVNTGGGAIYARLGAPAGASISADIAAATTDILAIPTTSAPTSAANAAALLKYDMSTITGEADRSPINALRFIRNKWSSLSGTLTVYKEDDSTSAWTATVTTNAAAEPIVGVSGSS